MNQIPENFAPSTPATSAQIGEALKVLFNSLPFQRGTDPEFAAIAYIESLRGMTADAITEGIRKFLRGECEGIGAKYVPTPPELARIVRTAVVPSRIPAGRRVEARSAPTPAERGRMLLKISLWRAAFGTGRMDEVARASHSGFEASIALAQTWGVAVSEETWAALQEPGAEQEWQRVHRQCQMEIERNPPPYARHRNMEAESWI